MKLLILTDPRIAAFLIRFCTLLQDSRSKKAYHFVHLDDRPETPIRGLSRPPGRDAAARHGGVKDRGMDRRESDGFGHAACAGDAILLLG